MSIRDTISASILSDTPVPFTFSLVNLDVRFDQELVEILSDQDKDFISKLSHFLYHVLLRNIRFYSYSLGSFCIIRDF